MYDFLLVGAGLFNAVVAHEVSRAGAKCLVIEKRSHIAGNCYTEEIEGITVHKYGAHIFRTSDLDIWQYVQQFSPFNNFINSPVARYKDEVYNLPFNMNTFSKMWNIFTPAEAQMMIDKQSKGVRKPATNLEEHAIGLVGKDLYEKLIKGYTEKQWGKSCRELPASIMRRIPLRFKYDNNYFEERYQGVPELGYTRMIEKMFSGADIMLDTDYLVDREHWNKCADTVIYTGALDAYFDYAYGELEYRSLRFEIQILDMENYQGVAVVNYTQKEIPYTRVIEHKHFAFGTQDKTVISYEYPEIWTKEKEPYYPLNDKRNNNKYERYLSMNEGNKKVLFGGRLGSYKYYDMNDTIKAALELSDKIGGVKRKRQR